MHARIHKFFVFGARFDGGHNVRLWKFAFVYDILRSPVIRHFMYYSKVILGFMLSKMSFPRTAYGAHDAYFSLYCCQQKKDSSIIPCCLFP